MENHGFLYDLENSLKQNWDLPALTDYKGKTNTYKEVAEQIAKLHILFEECGVKKGDKISIIGRNRSHWGIAFLACLSYGAVAVPILHEFKDDNIRHIVNHSESKIMLTGDVTWEGQNSSALPKISAIMLLNDFSILFSKNKNVFKVHENLDALFAKRYPKGFAPEHVKYHKDNRDELAVINYTSGTTGFSKGVMIPYRALWSNVHFARQVLKELKAGDSVVSILPMAHMYGMMFEFLYEITQGCHVYFLTRMPTPKIIMEAFAEIRPRLIIAVPLIIEKIYKKQLQPILEKPFIKMMLRLPVIDQRILKRINNKLTEAFGGNFIEIIVGGAALNPEVEAFFKKMNFRYTVGYGMTECAPIITYDGWKTNRLASCGLAAPRMEIKINSTDPENKVGEILVRGDNVMLGYYKNAEATKEVLKNGWLHTGDLGLIDKDGYLYIKGRSKNMILGASGQNIYPEEIENHLNNMDYVAESLVIDNDGKLVALVYPDFDSADRDNLRTHNIEKIIEQHRVDLNKHLPQYSQITRIKIMPEEFEKTPKKSIKRFMYQA